MKTKIYLFSAVVLSFFLFTGYNSHSNNFITEEKSDQTECPYLQQKSETSCPYLKGNVDDSNLECLYLSGELNCPNSGKKNQPETEPSGKEKSIEKKFYRTIKIIST